MSSSTSLFFPMIIMIVIWYFLLIRPQQKRAKDHKAMVQNMSKGDQIVTQGGIYGKVTAVAVDQNKVSVEIAKGVTIEVVKSTVQNVVAKK